MKIWLDDVRPAPPGWKWVRTSQEAIALLRYTSVEKEIEVISLDYDLGLSDCGDRVADYLARMVHPPTRVRIHSWNSVGARKMQQILAPRFGEVIWVPATVGGRK